MAYLRLDFLILTLAILLAIPNPASAQAQNGTNTTLPLDVLENAPIIPVSGSNESTIVQSDNSSLTDSRPDIANIPPSNITNLPDAEDLPPSDTALARRQQCQGGPLASPTTLWTNVKILADRVCNVWFPDNRVYYVKAPLDNPGFISVRIPVPGNPTFNFRYETRGAPPIQDLVTPLTSRICKSQYDQILAYAADPRHFDCANPPHVHAGGDCNNRRRSACFSFVLT
ncbi:hypothetical protein BDW59DRAFT_160207 [Aspergillus cavernicola]|uniref:Uncharacterized protein n=1 Tax=Aspergillus cavernicola TaxID=176166 RepID=A0ABR4IJY9_9EURO